MKIKFIGAVGGDVTGSCILCCARNGTRFLVDCGKFQGGGFTETKDARFPFDPKSIDFVLLTHAHLDHCGRIPSLYECGFAGKIICNKATRDLAILNFMDTLNKEKVLLDPENEMKKWKERFITEEQRPDIGETGPSFRIDNDVQISMFRSSHFLGCTSFSVGWNMYTESADAQSKKYSKTICFSGDLGSVIDIDDDTINHLPLLKDGFAPFVNTDYIVMESTYGAKTREPEYKDFDKRIAHLDKLVSADDVDTLVFACFSMQRTQDILFDLLYLAMSDKKHCFAITLDSPMGIKACEIYKSALMQLKPDKKNGGEKFVYLNEEFMDRFSPLLGADYMNRISEGCDRKVHAMRKFISDVLSAKFVERDNIVISFRNHDENHGQQTEKPPIEESPMPLSKKIYITSSGMFQYGRVLEHLQKRHGNERTAFFITGFCGSTGNGKAISTWAKDTDSIEKYIIYDEKRGKKIYRAKWKAKIHDIALYYSGHADAEGLLRFLLCSTKCGEGEGKKTVRDSDKKQVTVFLNHGDVVARAELKNKIEEESKKPEKQDVREIKKVVLPNATDPFFDLDSGEWDTNPNDLLAPVFTVPIEKLADVSKKQKKEKNKNSNG